MRVPFAVIVVVLGACSKDANDEVCTHYAKLAIECSEEKVEAKSLAIDMAKNICLKGMSGEHDQIFGARYKVMIECTRTAKTCADLAKCESE